MKRTLLVLLVLGAIMPAGVAPALPDGQVSAEVSGIAHLKAGEYHVEITVANRNLAPVDPADRAFRFSVQSDILGQWIELAWRRKTTDPNRNRSPLLRGEERKISVIVTLPYRLPHLYRNQEGEVNLRFQYAFTCTNDSQNCSGESSYWLNPSTDRWVLREGM